MRKLLFLTVSAFAAMTITAFASEDIAGTYEGWYYAHQGQTGLTLTVNDDNTGVFEFYNLPGKTNAKDGSYKVEVSQNDDGTYTVSGTEWIEQPSGYSYVTLKGALNDSEFSGRVNNSWDFLLYKNNDSYQQVADSTYKNHKYKIFDEELTWQEAKEACEAQGGHLVSIDSEEEQRFIEKLLADSEKPRHLCRSAPPGIRGGMPWD